MIISNVGYYRLLSGSNNNRRDDQHPLIVNCCGYYHTDSAFHSFNKGGRNDYYLMLCTKGSLPVLLPEGETVMEEGMFVVYRPGTFYRYYLNEGQEMCYHWIHFTGFYAERTLAELGIETNHIYNMGLQPKRRDRIIAQFQRLFDEFGLRGVGFDNACGALLTHILIDLSRGVGKITAGPTRKLSSIAYLHSHYKENTDMAALADMEHLSISRYREVFRRHTGFSPTEYRTILRLRHACDLLASTDMPVSQIAGECGYNDPLYFFRIFKAKEKMTPTEYRARSAAENL